MPGTLDSLAPWKILSHLTFLPTYLLAFNTINSSPYEITTRKRKAKQRDVYVGVSVLKRGGIFPYLKIRKNVFESLSWRRKFVKRRFR